MVGGEDRRGAGVGPALPVGMQQMNNTHVEEGGDEYQTARVATTTRLP